MTEATLKNTSPYAVADIRGNVEYRANGKFLATVPATVTGMLVADATSSLPVVSADITSFADAHETAFVPTSVAIIAAR